MQTAPTKQSRYRDRLRGQGLRPLQIWVLDTRKPGFAEECRRQSRIVRSDLREKEKLGWLTAVTNIIEGWL